MFYDIMFRFVYVHFFHISLILEIQGQNKNIEKEKCSGENSDNLIFLKWWQKYPLPIT